MQSILDILDNLGKGQSRAVKMASAHSAPCPFSLAKASVLSCNMQDVDRAVKTAIKERTTTVVGAVSFSCRSGMLFIQLPSGRSLAYVKPRIGENQFGGESVTYMGIGSTKKWERLESYGPKFVENIVQAISRDILCYAMQTLSHCFICGHVHDELIIECSQKVDYKVICEQMGRIPPWLPGILLMADEYETAFYMKD